MFVSHEGYKQKITQISDYFCHISKGSLLDFVSNFKQI